MRFPWLKTSAPTYPTHSTAQSRGYFSRNLLCRRPGCGAVTSYAPPLPPPAGLQTGQKGVKQVAITLGLLREGSSRAFHSHPVPKNPFPIKQIFLIKSITPNVSYSEYMYSTSGRQKQSMLTGEGKGHWINRPNLEDRLQVTVTLRL